MGTFTPPRSSTVSGWRRRDSCASDAVVTRARMKSIVSSKEFTLSRAGARSPAARVARCVVLALVASAALVAPAAAQRVLGTVRDSGTNEPIRGAVVSLADAAGKFLSRSIADTGGRFSVPRLAGAARLNVIRIGYKPRTVALSPNVADSIVDMNVDVRMESVVTLMSAVASTSTRVCPGDQSNAGALTLWEQARAALLASVVAREQSPP